MPSPYSTDLRLRVVQAVENGQSTREVGKHYQVSPSFVWNVYQLWKKTGSVQSKQIGGYRVAHLDAFREVLQNHLASHPSLTLKEIQTWLEKEHQKSLSISAIDKFIRHKLGYRYKKNGVRQ